MSDNKILWLEKYRPQILSDIVGNTSIIEKLKTLEQKNNIPNLILSGPPGVGKTTSILALARQVLGKNFQNACIELNASDERGINVIRTKIREFAEKLRKLPQGQHKIIILDEADSLTSAAQQALRMIISDYSNSTRFIFSCNHSSKIIEPIQSRCALLRFTKLEDKEILEFLLRVCKLENVKYDRDGLETLLFISEGDMRNAVNNLQAVFTSTGFVGKNEVFEVCDVPNTKNLFLLYNFVKEKNLEMVLDTFEGIWKEDYSIHDLINYLGKALDVYDDIDFRLKFKLLSEVAKLKVLESDGLGTKTQILGCLATMVKLAMNEA